MTQVHATDPATLYMAIRNKVTVLDVPDLLYAAVDGHGAPGDASFAEGIKGLYSVAYGARFALRDKGIEEKVSPLEALWSMPDAAASFADALAKGGFTDANKAEWSWRAMIRLPWAAEGEVVDAVREAALRRHPELAPALARVEIAPWQEGLSVQTLHMGPYSAELPTVQLMHDFIAEHGYEAVGRHHEIYLNDPRRCAPERIRTILRQPVRARP